MKFGINGLKQTFEFAATIKNLGKQENVKIEMLTIRYQFSYDTVIELIVMQELGKNAFLHLCIAHKWVLYSFLFRGC